MLHVIPDQLPWWLAGPGVGLCVVALYALANVKLGVSGGWLQLVFLIQRRGTTEPWRLWFTGAWWVALSSQADWALAGCPGTAHCLATFRSWRSWWCCSWSGC